MSSKNFSRAALLMATLGVTLMTGCYGTYQSGDGEAGIEVGLAPPELQTEVAIASPGDGYVWVPGYWDWGVNGQWAWVGGSWQRPEHERAVWVRPEYKNRHGHWHYRKGYWR